MQTLKCAALAVLPLALVACEKAGESETKTKIEVINAGSGEKHSLQLDFQAGDKQSAELRMHMDMGLPGGFGSVSMNMDFGYDLEILRVEEKGGDRIGHIKFLFTNVDLNISPSAPQVDTMIRKFKEIEGEGLVASMDQKGKQGYLKPVGDRIYPIFESLGMKTRDLEKMFDDIYPDIPAEPIGVGGSWRIEKTTKQQGNDIKLNVTYKLVKADKLPDGSVECTLDVSGRAEVKGPGGLKGGGDVSGQVVYIPARGRAKSGRVVTDITASAQGQSVTMRMGSTYNETSYTTE